MSESELKKRLHDLLYNRGVDDSTIHGILDEILDEAAKEFPDFEKLKLKYASVNKTGIDISALKAFQMQAEEWFRKWSGIAEVSP